MKFLAAHSIKEITVQMNVFGAPILIAIRGNNSFVLDRGFDIRTGHYSVCVVYIDNK